MLDWIIEPLSYAFMQRALISGLFIAIACAIFSCFLIVKGWSLMGDAIAHAVLPGIAIAHMTHLPLSIGATVSGLLCASAIGYLSRYSRVKPDTLMGIVFSGMFAVGLVLITHIHTNQHILHILFGNILGITTADFVETMLISGSCIIILLIKRRDLMAFCFDPIHTATLGMNNPRMQWMLLIILSLTIVSALKAAGIILVIALLITPGAIGFLTTKTWDHMLVIAVGTAGLSTLLGVIFSYHWDVATAPLIVLIQTGFFLLALFQTRR